MYSRSEEEARRQGREEGQAAANARAHIEEAHAFGNSMAATFRNVPVYAEHEITARFAFKGFLAAVALTAAVLAAGTLVLKLLFGSAPPGWDIALIVVCALALAWVARVAYASLSRNEGIFAPIFYGLLGGLVGIKIATITPPAYYMNLAPDSVAVRVFGLGCLVAGFIVAYGFARLVRIQHLHARVIAPVIALAWFIVPVVYLLSYSRLASDWFTLQVDIAIHKTGLIVWAYTLLYYG